MVREVHDDYKKERKKKTFEKNKEKFLKLNQERSSAYVTRISNKNIYNNIQFHV